MGAAAPSDGRSRMAKAWEFPKATFRLGDLLANAARPHEAAMSAAARALLRIDWASLRPSDRAKRLRSVVAALRGRSAAAAAALRPELTKAGPEALHATRARLRGTEGLGVSVDFNPRDRRLLRELPGLQVLFVRDHLGRRVDAFGAEARTIVARGLSEGLGRGDVADDLRRAADGLRSPAYWDVVAGSFMGTARSLGELSAYAEAGVQKYQLVAVKDEHTTPLCLFLDGAELNVGETLRRWDDTMASADPLALKDTFPWVRSRRDGEEQELWLRRGDQRVSLARVDAQGRSTEPRSSDRLSELGVGLPPFHGLCRTSTRAL